MLFGVIPTTITRMVSEGKSVSIQHTLSIASGVCIVFYTKWKWYHIQAFSQNGKCHWCTWYFQSVNTKCAIHTQTHDKFRVHGKGVNIVKHLSKTLPCTDKPRKKNEQQSDRFDGRRCVAVCLWSYAACTQYNRNWNSEWTNWVKREKIILEHISSHHYHHHHSHCKNRKQETLPTRWL